MKQTMEPTVPVILPDAIILPYNYSLGVTNTRFFKELRDHGRITGTRCTNCKVVYMPPRSTCPKCFGKLDEWVPLSHKGTVLSYTTANYGTRVQPKEPPLTYGLIQLDGADTGFVHLLGETDPEAVRIGMRVQAVLNEKREGNILDIRHFKPL